MTTIGSLSVLACRVCLSLEENNVMMDTANGWLELFSYCFGLEIHLEEEARALCENCADCLKSFAVLKLKCHESNEVWKSLKEQQLEMHLRNDKVTTETLCEELLLIVSEESNENNDKELTQENDPILVKNNNDETDFIIESLDNLEDKNIDDKNSDNESEGMDSDHKMDENNSDYKTDGENSDNKMDGENSDHKMDGKISDNKTDGDNSNNKKDGKISDNKTDGKCSLGVEKSDNAINLQSIGNKIDQCLCGKTFKYASKSYKNHIQFCAIKKFNELPENQYGVIKSCGLCAYTTKSANNLRKHFGEHDTNNDLGCKLCGFYGQDFAEMVYHRYKHLPPGKWLHCLRCLFYCQHPRMLQFHFRTVHLKKEKGGLCLCGAAYRTLKQWRRHESKTHPGLRTYRNEYICDHCGRKYEQRRYIISHLNSGVCLKTKATCDICGVELNASSLKGHHLAFHSSIPAKLVECPECLKSVKEINFRRHVQAFHRQKYICEICSAEFQNKNKFDYHMQKHTKKRYNCNMCNASYMTKGTLKLHMRKHSNEVPFLCKVCGKGFPTLEHLKVHAVMHPKIKCEMCDEKFNIKRQLIEHCAQAHQEMLLVA